MTLFFFSQGNLRDLSKHYKDQQSYHNQLSRKAMKDLEQSIVSNHTETSQKLAYLKSDLTHLQSDVTTKMQPLVDAVLRAETTLQQLQEGFGELCIGKMHTCQQNIISQYRCIIILCIIHIAEIISRHNNTNYMIIMNKIECQQI